MDFASRAACNERGDFDALPSYRYPPVTLTAFPVWPAGVAEIWRDFVKFGCRILAVFARVRFWRDRGLILFIDQNQHPFGRKGAAPNFREAATFEFNS